MATKGIVAGCLLFCHAIFHAWAISLTKAAYMISVKRLSILFSVITGGALFKEKNIKIRLLGAILMLLGAVIITIKGQ
jgi:drug/metabolite transporter (DMT)-like permease